MRNSRIQSHACIAPPMTVIHRLQLALLPTALCLVAAAQPAFAGSGPQEDWQTSSAHSPLVDEVRTATARFANWNTRVTCEKQGAK